jgi:pyruvate/2-oxoglutarate dehydrogenase complex dihydrolipoamide acyltransferase (E2) component
VEDVGEGAGGAVGGLGKGAGQALGGVGQLAGGGGGGGSGGQGNGGNGGGNGMTGGHLAKEAAKVVAREIGSAATDEVKDLGLAATQKAVELGERRRHRRASRHNATEAALREAEAAGIDLDEVEGTGAEGRITAQDVKGASSR